MRDMGRWSGLRHGRDATECKYYLLQVREIVKFTLKSLDRRNEDFLIIEQDELQRVVNTAFDFKAEKESWE